MPLIKFVGGPHDGSTCDIPEATGGAPVAFNRESGRAEYEFTGSYTPGTGARVYRIKDAAEPVVTDWPEPEREPVKRPPRKAPAKLSCADEAEPAKKAPKPRAKAADKDTLKAAFQS